MHSSAIILKAREAVEKYRANHTALYLTASQTKSDDHTLLLEAMLKTINELGFKSISDVWKESDELAAKELGYKSVANLKTTATTLDKATFAERWK